jgi:hypothetical protein
MKKSAEHFWVTLNSPPNIKRKVPAFFGDRFEGKEDGLRTYMPSSQELGDKKNFVLSGLGL